jgi:hypothetical protein
MTGSSSSATSGAIAPTTPSRIKSGRGVFTASATGKSSYRLDDYQRDGHFFDIDVQGLHYWDAYARACPRVYTISKSGGLRYVDEIIKNANDRSKRTEETLEIPLEWADPAEPVLLITEALRETSYVFGVSVESDSGRVPFEIEADVPRAGSTYVLEQGMSLRLVLSPLPRGIRRLWLTVDGYYVPWR